MDIKIKSKNMKTEKVISSSNSSNKNSSSGATKSKVTNISEIEKDLLNSGRDLLESVTMNNVQNLNSPSNLARKGAATDFNILVCGAAGVGKSSFVELFLKKFNFTEAKQ
jgi:predicted GTPase